MPRAVIFGARGTLGQALAATLPDRGFVVAGAFGHEQCDIVDATRVRELLGALRPEVVFNTAAYNDVDGAETHAEAAFAVNARGPETLAREAAAIGAKLVHYSTDYVFDGESERPYDESDAPSPQGVYAQSKLAGERSVLAVSPQAFVLRVGCLYGRGGNNFPSSIMRRLGAGETIRADRDRLGSPTWVVPVAVVSAALAHSDAFGLYHATAAGETTWVDYARFLATRLGLPPSRVEALSTAALDLRAPRPRRAILDNRRLRERNLDTLGSWQEEAVAYLASESAQRKIGS